MKIRVKRVLKWTAIVFGGLVAIGLLANAVFVWTTDTRLEKQLAAIRAAGDPLTLADLARPPIPPEQNAATYLRRAEPDMKAIEKETADITYLPECPGFILPPEDQEKIKDTLAAYPNVIQLIAQAAACPEYDAELDFTLPSEEFLEKSMDFVGEVRLPARVLYYRAALLVAEGNRDEAVQTALTIFRLSRHFDRDPMVVSYLTAIAVRGYAIQISNAALQTGAVSENVRDALDAELAVHKPIEGFGWALKSERAFNLARFPDIIPARNFWLVARGLWNMQESACLELYPTLIELASPTHTYREFERSYSELEKGLEGHASVFAALLFPALKGGYEAGVRTEAAMRSLRVLNALQTHVPAERDEVPTLSGLGLPEEATIDPFNGQPLRVKKTPRGWLVYSVGRNLKDDGGKVDSYDDVGVGPPPAE